MKTITSVTILLTIIVISSCTYNIKGNYITLEPDMSDDRGIVDKYNIPILRLLSIYFSSEGGKEYVTLKYNNNFSEKLVVSKKEAEKEWINYVLGDKHYLSISKSNLMVFNCNLFEYERSWGKYEESILKYREYAKISSIKTLESDTIENLPNFNRIAEYKKRCEVGDNVKKVIHNVYDKKNMFGEDTLVLKSQYIYTFNKSGKLLSKSFRHNNDKYRQTDYLYNERGNLIEEIRSIGTSKAKIIYEYIEDRLVRVRGKKITPYFGLVLPEEIHYKYNESNQLKEIDFYDLDYNNKLELLSKHKFDYTDYGENIMTSYSKDGESKYKNYYDMNNSLYSGVLYFGGFAADFYVIDKEYPVCCNIEVSYTPSTVKISLNGRIPSWGIVNQDEEYHFDANCNQVFLYSLVNTKDKYSNTNLHQNILYSYVYDSNGNWIKRRGDIYKAWGNGNLNEESNTIIEVREIEYY